MKKNFLLSGLVTYLLCAVCVSSQAIPKIDMDKTIILETKVPQSKGKVLVAYFTLPETDGVDASSGASRVVTNGKLLGNTEYIAHLISEETGGDLFAIKTVQAYPGTHQALVDAAKKEADAGVHPQLATHIKDLETYEVIFVGYPNWWYDMPMPIYSFFEEYDFKDKIIIPFCTHGGSRFSQSVETIATLEKEAKVVKGPSIPSGSVPEARQRILNWLEGQGLLKK